jgi:multidrug efflux pump subunit AcrA (membrane-fusion protein)
MGDRMEKKLLALILISVPLLFAAGCGKKEETAANQTTAAEIRNIAVTKVTRSSIEDFYEATGTVKAKTTTQISANIMGRIVSLPVAEGDTVSRGQVLAEIDASESRAQFQKAQASLQEDQASLSELDRSIEAANAGTRTVEANKHLAEVTYGRYRELFDRGSASAQEFDEAQSKLKMATSELEQARANVQTIASKRKQINARIDQAKADIASTRVSQGYSRIVAPVSGMIVKKFTEAGATASPGVPLLSIEDNSQYRLEAAVEESRSKMVHVGNRVNVHIDALGSNDIMGTVAEITPSSEAASRTYTVKIDLPADPQLKTGLYGLARFPLSQKEAITVPQTAIIQRGQLTGVYIVGQDGTVQFRIVTAGKTSEGMVEVLSGLSEGDEIAASDVERLSDGMKVR